MSVNKRAPLGIKDMPIKVLERILKDIPLTDVVTLHSKNDDFNSRLRCITLRNVTVVVNLSLYHPAPVQWYPAGLHVDRENVLVTVLDLDVLGLYIQYIRNVTFQYETFGDTEKGFEVDTRKVAEFLDSLPNLTSFTNFYTPICFTRPIHSLQTCFDHSYLQCVNLSCLKSLVLVHNGPTLEVCPENMTGYSFPQLETLHLTTFHNRHLEIDFAKTSFPCLTSFLVCEQSLSQKITLKSLKSKYLPKLKVFTGENVTLDRMLIHTLTSLDIRESSGSSPQTFDSLPELQSLQYNNSSLTLVPSLSLAQLKRLDLSNNRIQTISPLSLPSLTHLDLSFNSIVCIEELENLPMLKTLLLHNNSIKSIQGLECLRSLVNLDLLNNHIETIEGLGKLTQLESLSLERNKISTVINLASQQHSLKKLSIAHNRITKVKEVLNNFTKLSLLDLSGNKISSFENINAIPSLSNLYMSLNDFDHVDKQLNYPNLASMSLYNNYFTEGSFQNAGPATLFFQDMFDPYNPDSDGYASQD